MPKRKRRPAPASPHALERSYERAVQAIAASLRAEVKEYLRGPFQRAQRAAAASAREDARDFADLDFGPLRLRLGRLAKGRASRILDQFGKRITAWNKEDLERLIKVDLGAEPPAVRAVLAAWRRENVDLITSISDRLLDDVETVVTDAVRKGTRVETLAKQVAERYAVSDSRARLIARDQVLKANADLTRTRHAEAGVTRYVWSSSRDERVRPMHKDLEGTTQAWDSPPVTNVRGDRNHPGGDFQCRCVAIPILDD